jgi:asparaginyl-tRNA synthetase
MHTLTLHAEFMTCDTLLHLARMQVEPEMSFCDLFSAMKNAEEYVKYVITYALRTCSSDFDFFYQYVDSSLRERLQKMVSQPFYRVEYRQAINLLQAEIERDPSSWEFKDVQFGIDLQTEHERWLAEKYFNGCVFVHNYPRHIKVCLFV